MNLKNLIILLLVLAWGSTAFLISRDTDMGASQRWGSWGFSVNSKPSKGDEDIAYYDKHIQRALKLDTILDEMLNMVLAKYPTKPKVKSHPPWYIDTVSFGKYVTKWEMDTMPDTIPAIFLVSDSLVRSYRHLVKGDTLPDGSFDLKIESYAGEMDRVAFYIRGYKVGKKLLDERKKVLGKDYIVWLVR